jgi:exoribonuclease R
MDLTTIKNSILVGILSTSQQVKLGKTKSGKPIFLVSPIDKKLPKFWMTYGGKLQGKIVILFKFKEIKDNNLMAELYNVIGLANEENLSKALMYHYKINRKETELDCKLNDNESKITRKDLSHLNVFSIDPKGCIDIDDALSIEKENSTYKVGVHIAQPICWLSKEEIEQKATIAFSTLYCESNVELWNKKIVENSSLEKNKTKFAYSTIFTIKDNTIESIESFPSIIIPKINTCYEEIDFSDIQDLLKLTKQIINKDIDSHELVSFWMIQTNNYIGKNFTDIPLRVQKETISEKMLDIDPKIKNTFLQFNQESASYSSSLDETFHSSLQLENYTHFTSPIRRIIDTIIHYQITYNQKIETDLIRINLLDKHTKKFHRQMKLNEIINSIPENINNEETNGWIYKKLSNYKWLVYFENIGLLKVDIVDKKLEYLIKDEESEKYKIGFSYPFKIYKKPGFLPNEKILIVPGFSLL